jgi:hypothetical protein
MKTLLALVALTCTPAPPPSPAPEPAPTPSPSPISSPSPAPTVVPGNDCPSICRHLADMSCEAALPTKAGSSCVDVCLNTQHSGTIQYPFGCVLAARSCSAADSCFR